MKEKHLIIDEETHQRIKIEAAKAKKTIKDFIKDWIEGEKDGK